MSVSLKYLKENFGATIEPSGEFAKGLKFVASSFGNEIKANIDAIDDEYISMTLREYKRIARKFNAFVGMWIDGKTLYIDISHNFEDKNQALEFAKSNRQLAIFDATTKEVITV